MRSWRFCLVSAHRANERESCESARETASLCSSRHCSSPTLPTASWLKETHFMVLHFLTYFIFFSSSFCLTARPKSPSLNSMSALRKKLPTLMSRCITRWACRYEHAWTAWNIRYRTSGSVSLPRFLRVCTKDCIKLKKKKTQVNSWSRSVSWLRQTPGVNATYGCSRVV